LAAFAFLSVFSAAVFLEEERIRTAQNVHDMSMLYTHIVAEDCFSFVLCSLLENS